MSRCLLDLTAVSTAALGFGMAFFPLLVQDGLTQVETLQGGEVHGADWIGCISSLNLGESAIHGNMSLCMNLHASSNNE